MPSQNSDDSDTRYQSHTAHHEVNADHGRTSDDDAEDLGLGASNKAVGITLTIGVGLMLLVLILPYLGGV
ncbi:hypothetical protein GCM10023354_12480 [Garicola koreensis]|uniref:hypothetical protein n=1 Tax=Garicola koreensis TaxID=1262554 RepID=UPI0031EA3E14